MISRDIDRAAEHLRQGRTVVIPTETVYGLGADATNARAVEKIFAIKGRPKNHPLIVHIGDSSGLAAWAEEIPPAARRLAGRFWPGPLTLVLPRRRSVLPEVTGGQNTVALRVPDHPVTLRLLQAFGGGIAAPSANRFGQLSPTSARHVQDEFGESAGMILEGGPCSFGVESTIVGFREDKPVLLRPGAISSGTIEAFLGVRLLRNGAGQNEMRVPGSTLSHYAPKTPLEVLSTDDIPYRLLYLTARGQKAGLLSLSRDRKGPASEKETVFSMPMEAIDYGRVLYSILRSFDRAGLERILVESPPRTTEWEAVNDRLARAALHPLIPECPAPPAREIPR